MRKVTITALALVLRSAFAFAQGARQATGAVQGLVFVADADGGRPVVPATKITLDGPMHLEAQGDREGKFTSQRSSSGSYTIKPQSTGMATAQGVVVTAGVVSEVQLGMKPEAVTHRPQ